MRISLIRILRRTKRKVYLQVRAEGLERLGKTLLGGRGNQLAALLEAVRV